MSSDSGLTRREALRAGAAGGTALALATAGVDMETARALAQPARCGRLDEIEHVVIFINENRSFDSYFGTYPGVRGFSDPHAPKLRDGSGRTVFNQPGYTAQGFGGHLFPFHFDTYRSGECVNDITHDWGPQHRSWNGGRMDSFVKVHEADDRVNGSNTMGYYTRKDLAFYYALADAFTLCDHYHCSVLGPTDPNRFYTISATLDPAGAGGGPQLSTLVASRQTKFFKYTWTTMPERLRAHGISWKVYTTPDTTLELSPFPYFKAYAPGGPLFADALTPTFPGTFEADAAAGTLPQVSWVLAPLIETEHPPAAVTYGEVAVARMLRALTSNPTLWAKTAAFVTWDENGGFFDHVPPPTAPPGTPGEYVTVSPLPSDAQGIAGPIGLGFRVGMLVVSPFSRGGFVSSDVFDHTSTLRFLERRFGVEVPNLSAWRRSVTGDLTAAFNFARPDASVPSLPSPSSLDRRVIGSDCPTQSVGLLFPAAPTVKPYPPPPNHMPVQEAGTRSRPSGVCAAKKPPHRKNGHHKGHHHSGAHHHRHGSTPPPESSGERSDFSPAASATGSAGAGAVEQTSGGGLPFTGLELGGLASLGALLSALGAIIRRRMDAGPVDRPPS